MVKRDHGCRTGRRDNGIVTTDGLVPDPFPPAGPSLAPAGGAEPSGPAVRPRAPRAMCRMTDGTWLLVWVDEWRQVPGGQWAVLLRWSIAGKLRDGWFMHEPDRLKPVVPGEPFPELRTPDSRS